MRSPRSFIGNVAFSYGGRIGIGIKGKIAADIGIHDVEVPVRKHFPGDRFSGRTKTRTAFPSSPPFSTGSRSRSSGWSRKKHFFCMIKANKIYNYVIYIILLKSESKCPCNHLQKRNIENFFLNEFGDTLTTTASTAAICTCSMPRCAMPATTYEPWHRPNSIPARAVASRHTTPSLN